jgi:hypothetical protein
MRTVIDDLDGGIGSRRHYKMSAARGFDRPL